MNKKTKIFFLFILFVSLIFYQSFQAQTIEDNDIQLNLLKSQDVLPMDLFEEGSEILGNDNDRFIIAVGGKSSIIMKEISDGVERSYWYVTISGISEKIESGIGLRKSVSSNIFIEAADVSLPTEFGLRQNYPNPFNPTTTINFQIPAGSYEMPTRLNIYDIQGRLIRTILNQKLPPGYYSEFWNGLNENGESVSSGIYFYSMSSGNFTSTRKMVVIK